MRRLFVPRDKKAIDRADARGDQRRGASIWWPTGVLRPPPTPDNLLLSN
jgi:hypothetical protein